jgi:hypothetical protein
VKQDDDDDAGAVWLDLKQNRRKLRAKFGHECPECREHRPKADATILLPGQRCKVDGFRDRRPPIEEG